MKKKIIIGIVLLVFTSGVAIYVFREKLFNNDEIKAYVGEKAYKDAAFFHTYGDKPKYYYTIDCPVLFEEDLKYFGEDFFLLENNDIYIMVSDIKKTMSNGEQCKKIKSGENINKIAYSFGFDVKSYVTFYIDDAYYRIKNGNLKSQKYTYEPLFEKLPDNVEKILYWNEHYPQGGIENKMYDFIYYIKEDNKLYKKLRSVDEKEEIVDMQKYGKVIDVSMSVNNKGKEVFNFILTTDSVYSLKTLNYSECKKHEDVECKKELVKSKFYEEFKDEIKYINSNYIVLKDNRILLTGHVINK